MQVPLEVAFHNIETSQWIRDYINERAEHLDRVSGGLVACRVVVECTQHQHNVGNPYRVRVEATLAPKLDLVGSKEEIVEDMSVQLRPIIRHAFDAVEKQAKKHREMSRGDVKRHAPATLSDPRPLGEPEAFVVRLFPQEGYGFLKVASDNEEFFFHRNAVLHDDFERIAIGTQVRFEPSMGEEGPQASSVQIIDKPGELAGSSGHAIAQPPAGWGT